MLCDFTMNDELGGQIKGKKVVHDDSRITLSISDEDSCAVLVLTKEDLIQLARKLLTMSEEMADE